MSRPEWFKCKSLLNCIAFQVDSLTKVSLILALWLASSSWKEQTIKQFVLIYSDNHPSFCCLHPAALKAWTGSEGVDWIARSSGSWSYPKLGNPNGPSHLGLIASYLVPVNRTWTPWGAPCWQSPGVTMKPLFQDDVPLEYPSHQKFLVLLDGRQIHGYLLLEESLYYSRSTVLQCTQPELFWEVKQ